MAANNPHNRPTSLSNAIYRIQYALIDSPSTSPAQLLTVGSLLSQSDYQDVIIERSIAGLCGSPLCPNHLPPNPNPHARFRISLPQHRVYDLEETHKYCSEACMVRSHGVFSGLSVQRAADANGAKVEQVLREFGELKGIGGLRIGEKEVAGAGDVCFDEWVGAADAIEGYVPRRGGAGDSGSNFIPQQHSKKRIEGTGESGTPFTSILLVGNDTDEIHSKKPLDVKPMIAKKGDASTADKRSKPKKTTSKTSKVKLKKNSEDCGCNNVDFSSNVIAGIEFDDHNALSFTGQDTPDVLAKRLENVVLEENKTRKKAGISKLSRVKHHQKLKDATNEKVLSKEINGELIDVCFGKESDKTAFHKSNYGELSKKNASSNEPIVIELEDKISSEKKTRSEEKSLKSCLKTSGSRIGDRSIKWADEISNKSLEDKMPILQESFEEHFDSSIRFASAEACAIALTQAAESTVSRKVEAGDAVSEAGILILPQSQSLQEERKGEDNFEIDRGIVKWPKKTVLLDTDMFEVEDSWHDTPPEGFSLNLSPFSTMWMSLFGWITCSSLAYIYGHDESSYENFMNVNGKEYPRKVTMSNDQSLEIRKTVDSFICRTLPNVVEDLRLQLPVSTLEKFMGCLLNTMSFMDAIPSFKIRQWHVIILLFIEALSIHRLLVLAPHLMSRGTQLQQMLIAAQISYEEYETMRDLILPLGRSTAKNGE